MEKLGMLYEKKAEQLITSEIRNNFSGAGKAYSYVFNTILYKD